MLALSALTGLTGSPDNFWQMRVHSRDGPAPKTRLGGGRGTASALGDSEMLGIWHKACSLRRRTGRKAAPGARRTRPPGGRQEAERRAQDAAAGLGAAAEQADALRGELGRMRAALAVREAAVLARLQARRPAAGAPGGAGGAGARRRAGARRLCVGAALHASWKARPLYPHGLVCAALY